MKKYYCPHCNKFKSRFQIKEMLIGYDVYCFECKWCHEPVVLSEYAISNALNDIKIIKQKSEVSE